TVGTRPGSGPAGQRIAAARHGAGQGPRARAIGAARLSAATPAGIDFNGAPPGSDQQIAAAHAAETCRW
ncbi:MAG: hypothetical protein Q4615_02710, partial [Paracoccus aminovorans]|nr:hypothetical protein [Paracoccus aminovorans]